MRTLVGVLVMALGLFVAAGAADTPHVQIAVNEAARRVDVTVDGQPFTSYIWPATLTKPVLYPIRSARGTLVTRGYPLEPRPGERVDHPHQVGLWFTYGDVNGIDFWNSSAAVPEERRSRMGTIVHRRIVHAEGGDAGVLEVEADWVMPDGSVVLRERTRFVFRGTSRDRTIDRETTLRAGRVRVAMTDNKEGVFGLRVARALEEPSSRAEILVGRDGRPTAEPVLDNTGVNGEYLTSEGVTGSAVWGTRARWCALSGDVDGERVSIAVFDAPSNPGYPTYWHARGYGLFAANPLGQQALSGGRDVLDFAIEPDASATFRYRVLIASAALTAAEIESAWKAWASATGGGKHQ
ncbi:MAG TPA: PmoA family protein [Vicinamibacterales bacterium]